MAIRRLTPEDAPDAARFALLAAFAPDREPPAEGAQLAHVRRWVEDWGDELGAGWEEEGELIGAAWARRVEPVLVRDPETGQPLPEVILAVASRSRGAGIGRRLMEALLTEARAAGCPGLALTVSQRNVVALRLYERVGFVRHGNPPSSGFVTMVWRA